MVTKIARETLRENCMSDHSSKVRTVNFYLFEAINSTMPIIMSGYTILVQWTVILSFTLTLRKNGGWFYHFELCKRRICDNSQHSSCARKLRTEVSKTLLLPTWLILTGSWNNVLRRSMRLWTESFLKIYNCTVLSSQTIFSLPFKSMQNGLLLQNLALDSFPLARPTRLLGVCGLHILEFLPEMSCWKLLESS